VVYDVAERAYRTYRESEVDRLLLDLVLADRVVGFNVARFDLRVLSGYTPWDLRRIRFFDLLAEIRGLLGFRLSLAHLAEANLGEGKSADGLTSLRWWKEGRVDLIEAYCRRDVEVTHRLYALGAERGYLLYRDREGRALRMPVAW
jgi:DEAD/DEAH box helicase domain-containing protein